MAGDLSETVNRSLRPANEKNNKILQRGSVNSFIFSTPGPLGSLDYIRIWHDNSGQGRTASWFLKLIIVHDLQTREESCFICENWLALDREDGSVDRLLPVACEKQQSELMYLIEKQTKDKMSDGHLWFSILARPALSSFSRTERLTCCLVFLYMTMMMNIIYYDASKSKGTGFIIGPLSFSSTQVLIGLISALIVIPPSFLVIQLFKRSRKRVTKSEALKEAMKTNNREAYDENK